MLRQMKGFNGLAAASDFMSLPDSGGGGGDSSPDNGIWTLPSTPVQPWAFGPSSPSAEVVDLPGALDTTASNNFPGVPSYTPPINANLAPGNPGTVQQGPPASAARLSTSSVPAAFSIFGKSSAPAAAPARTVAQGGSAPKPAAAAASSGSIFGDITKVLTSAATAAMTIANPPAPAGFARDPKTGKLVPLTPAKSTTGGSSHGGGGATPWGTYLLIGGGVLLAGVALIALTKKKGR